MNQNEKSVRIPIRQITAGFNYRRRFNKTKMDELVEDIKRQGLLQDILIRPLNGAYQVVAGHRRLRAVELAFGEEAEIGAMVRIMTDAEATAAMVSENKIREDTSAIEDAEAATRMLGLLNGDREETARRLGWSPHTLNARLGLMNATDKVRDAYIDEKILLGHVEILAALIKDVQDGVLEKMLARPKVPTVPELKAMAEQILLNLDAAIFDKGECGGCHYNTGKQQAMFETSFEGTRCTNRGCYEKKTETELESRRQALTGDYQVVRIVRPGDNMTVVPLRATGAKGVGEDQALACRTCGDFGACISAAPDKLGMSFKDVCFNSTCNAEKVDARVKAEQQTEAAAKEQETAGAAGADEAKEKSPAPKGTNSTKAAKAPTKAASSEPRNAVKEYRESVWRKVFQRAALRLPVAQSRALLIALCLHSPRTLSHSDATKAVGKVIGHDDLSSLEAGGLLGSLLKLDQKGLGDSMQQIPAFVGTDLSINAIAEMMTALDIKIEQHWKVNEAFFDLLTKTEVDAVCIELGLDKAIGKEYPKLKVGGKADYIKAILAIDGYDYVGKIPALMRW
ncbi:PRTRC system ParB family protein [Polaromonas aquatica]|uniref:PRTRC system ParB family protein n=1 Tax=Polaromonas aquatica TaxID=332657 RepID=A0ABW1TU90_9BURK